MGFYVVIKKDDELYVLHGKLTHDLVISKKKQLTKYYV